MSDPILNYYAERSRMRRAAERVIKAITALPPHNPRDARRDWLAPPPVSAFQHIEPLGFDPGNPTDSEWWIFDPAECTPDVLWPVNVAFALNREEILGERHVEPDMLTGRIQLLHVKSIEMRQARSFARRFSRYMARVDVAAEDRGVMVTAASLVSWLGGRWVDAQDRPDWSEKSYEGGAFAEGKPNPARDMEETTFRTSIAIAVALRQRYEWAVALGFDGSPTIRFATDPTGIKELWRVRDLPEGRDRRPALYTWIEDHWRQQRRDPDIEVYVREHLRGARRFSWRDMVGEIVPSQFDLDKRDRLIVERDAMRRAGTDRRRAQKLT